MRTALTALLGAALSAAAAGADEITWKKTVIEKKFRAEGVAVADVNKDGKNDILVGDVWYEAPDWKIHEIRKPGDFGDGSKGYSQSFACWAEDVNGDGWQDLIVIGFPGAPWHWYENPQNKPGHWKQRVAGKSACNETPLYADLFGDGKKVLIMGVQPEAQVGWFAPNADVEKPWDFRAVSGAEKVKMADRFYHGLGVGDVNGDGRQDIITPDGWWEQPAEGRKSEAPWKFHKCKIGSGCADMYVIDADADGKADIFSSAAHSTGIWWHKQIAGKTDTEFKTTGLFTDENKIKFSQTHAMNYAALAPGGKKVLITGKRMWAHGPKGDDDPAGAKVLYWIDVKPGEKPGFTFNKIDDDSGVGTQFWVGDFNGDGLTDVAIANKNGVFLIEQVGAKK